MLPLIEKNMSIVSFAQGDMDIAVRHFNKSLELAPSLVESQYWLGGMLCQTEERGRGKSSISGRHQDGP